MSKHVIRFVVLARESYGGVARGPVTTFGSRAEAEKWAELRYSVSPQEGGQGRQTSWNVYPVVMPLEAKVYTVLGRDKFGGVVASLPLFTTPLLAFKHSSDKKSPRVVKVVPKGPEIENLDCLG
jgi:hypothetical protein